MRPRNKGAEDSIVPIHARPPPPPPPSPPPPPCGGACFHFRSACPRPFFVPGVEVTVLATKRTRRWRAKCEIREHQGDAAGHVDQIGQPVEGGGPIHVRLTRRRRPPACHVTLKTKGHGDARDAMRSNTTNGPEETPRKVRKGRDCSWGPRGCVHPGQGSAARLLTDGAATRAARSPLAISTRLFHQII